MGPDIPSLLRGAGKLILVVVLSVAVGAGLGIALSRLSGDEKAGAAEAPATRTPAAPGSSGATDPSGATEAARGAGLRVRVLSSTFTPAATAAGRARRRGRVSVKLSVTAGAEKATITKAVLVSDEDSVRADPSAERLAADLRSIPARRTAQGEVRFEISGAVTTRLNTTLRAQLRVAGHTQTLRLTRP